MVALIEALAPRCICLACHGWADACSVCGTTGLVCPHCRGAGWLRDNRHGAAPPYRAVPCPSCVGELGRAHSIEAAIGWLETDPWEVNDVAV